MEWLNAVAQGVLLGGLYALLATGLSLAFGVMRIVNLAQGIGPAWQILGGHLVGAVAIGLTLFAPQGLWGLFTARWPVSLFGVQRRLRPAQPPGASP